MNEIITIQGRETTREDVELICELIVSHPTWGRTDLSKELCRLWDWKGENGQIKDMACRSFLLKIEARGFITLPARKYNYHGRYSGRGSRRAVEHSTEPITETLDELRPISVKPIGHTNQLPLFKFLLRSYHYLGYSTVGKSMKYMVFDSHERPLACFLFGSAAWKCAPRDEFIGWDTERREANINLITGNTRFLILPWVEVAHLASHILGKVVRRISSDWMDRYHHPVWMLETFVDRERFSGVCYRAANWMCVGQTRGRGRQDRSHKTRVPVKDIYLYPLSRQFRQMLCG